MQQSRRDQSSFSAALVLLGRAWRRQIDDALRPIGLSEATVFPLLHIHRSSGAVRQGAIAEAIGIEGPSLVRLLDQLCAAGFTERREDGTDRRAKTVHLTAAGRAAVQRAEILLTEARGRLLAGVSGDDLAACLRVFTTVRGTIGAGSLAPLPEAEAAE